MTESPTTPVAGNPASEQKQTLTTNDEDICGLCGKPGADKMPHPLHWPGEQEPDTDLVHAECEQEECGRAHAELSDEQRRNFLKWC
ncbi:MAG: hypothetical protein WCD70_15005 [Alphaproteobacteria bacterium]